MKRIYLSVLSLAIVGAVSAQVASEKMPEKRTVNSSENVKPVTNNTGNESKVVIWSNDFSVGTDWAMSNTSSPAQDWTIETDPNLVPAWGPANMTTVANGYGLIDSDGAGQSANQNADLTYTGTIDLTLYPNVVIEFEQHYRTYLDTRSVMISTDGGTTWDVVVVTDGTEANTNVDAPFSANISAIAGGQASVMLKFNYVGSWGWHWAVDDVAIIEQPVDDVQLLSAWVVGENNEGIEYGRYPNDQMDANWLVGGEVFNFGAATQTNIALNADFVSWSSNMTHPSLLPDSTVYLENTETPTLANGLYEGTYSLVSAEETGGAAFGNNSGLRNFEVNDDLYSQDGINVHPAADLILASLGTDSWTDGSGNDGLILASMYHIKNTMDVEGFEILLANGTDADAEINIKFIDTALFFADDMSPFAQSSVHIITAAEVAAGVATVYFPALVTLNPGAYFAAVECISNGGSTNVRILNDETVAQPWYASMIYIPADAAYSNGNAWGIRLKKGYVGLEEVNLDGVSVYPNPSEGVINVTNTNNDNNTIVVTDVAGKVVYEGSVNSEVSIDLSSNGTGVYFVKVSNENGSIVEKVVIK